MNRMLCLLLFAIAMASAGCNSDTAPPAPVGPLPPLSVAEWKQLPIEEKYDEATFERLREKDPKLQDDRGWDSFMREVVIPERKQDIPGTPGVTP